MIMITLDVLYVSISIDKRGISSVYKNGVNIQHVHSSEHALCAIMHACKVCLHVICTTFF